MGERKIRCRLISTLLITLLSINLFSGCSKPGTHTKTALPSGNSSSQPQLPDGKGGSYKTGNPYMVAGRWYTPMQGVKHYDQTGIASWYGADFHGKLTANGESYDMYSLSAAHKTLPLPTLVRVTNLENGRSVIVRVNDRGPFVKNRLIDLSYAASNVLGFMDQGTTRVRVQTLDQKPETRASTPQPSRAGIPTSIATPETIESRKQAGIFIQTGAFNSEGNANNMKHALMDTYPSAELHPKQIADKTLYRVRIGPFNDMKQVEKTVVSLQKSGFNQAIVIIE